MGEVMGEIRVMEAADWSLVRNIYAAGIAGGQATFEITPPDWEHFDSGKLAAHRFVAVEADRVVGWVAASGVSDRCVYQGVVEVSVYVDPVAAGRGIGSRLLAALISSTESAGIWTVQAGIFPRNAASLALHHKAGFRVVGVRERLGRHQDGWRDVLLLERRSPRI